MKTRSPGEWREGILAWLAGFLVIFSVHLIWESLDQSPPAWDMAYHQLQGWRLLEAAREGVLWANLPTLSPAYPPLYYLQEALVLSLFGDSQFLALISNLPGFLLLTGATYLLLRGFLERPLWAGLGANLPLLFPFMAWVSRESLLDIDLAGFVSMAGFCILWSRGFSRLGPTLTFGLLALGGVLTKWTFPLYVLGPMLFGVIYLSEARWRSLRNLCWSGLLAIPLSLLYYGPLLTELAGRYPTTEQAGLIPWRPYPRHGEPGLNNIWGWIYYPRVVAGYFLQLPLLIFLAAALAFQGRSATRSGRGKEIAGLCLCWLSSGSVLLIFLTPKDPRFFLPLVCPLVVLLLWLWRERPAWMGALLSVAFLQFLLVSFGTPWGPVRWASWVWNEEADYQSLQHEWVWFQTYYFDAAGPPDRSDWHYAEIVSRIEPGTTVVFLPEMARFDPDGFLLESVRRQRNLRLLRLGNDPDWETGLSTADYLVGKTGNQGISFITTYNLAIQARVKNSWKLLQEWPLPDGSRAQLWGRGG